MGKKIIVTPFGYEKQIRSFLERYYEDNKIIFVQESFSKDRKRLHV